MVHLGKLEHPLIDQMMVYEAMRQELESNCFGRWVVIDDGRLVGEYETFEEARADARKKGLNPLKYLTRQVGIEPPIVISYGERNS